MEQRHVRDQDGDSRRATTSLAIWLAGTVPTAVYGAAIGGLSGAALGMALWVIACLAIGQVRRLRRRHRERGSSPRLHGPAHGQVHDSDHQVHDSDHQVQERDHPVSRGAIEAELFDQLRRTPCVLCGSPTLLDRCLDCAEQPSPQRRHQGDDLHPGEDPDDPAFE